VYTHYLFYNFSIFNPLCVSSHIYNAAYKKWLDMKHLRFIYTKFLANLQNIFPASSSSEKYRTDIAIATMQTRHSKTKTIYQKNSTKTISFRRCTLHKCSEYSHSAYNCSMKNSYCLNLHYSRTYCTMRVCFRPNRLLLWWQISVKI
jgi:hypothetical protein